MKLNKHKIKDVFLTALGKLPEPHIYRSLEDAYRYRTGPDSRQTIILRDQVIKRQSPELARIESEKTRRAAYIGEQCGWFGVSKIIAPLEQLGEIHFEKLRNVVPLWHVLRYDDDANDVLVRVGRSLAAIHNSLQLPPQMCAPMTPKWNGDYPMVYLHGDLTVFNILVSSDRRSIWIIDWMVCESIGHMTATVGPSYFDIAWFIRSMHTQRYFGLAKIHRIDEKADVCLSAYFEESRHSCSRYALRDYMSNIFLPIILPSLRYYSPRLVRTLKPFLGRNCIPERALAKFIRLFSASPLLASSK